ncbi:lasso peptide biosynthesis PqqD family chaperone [Amycolatopsis anabasis]|uniref:lasso peptide biosynthesis PqqD family chaperone n=1 Tax=Amycolatopsis anabasis TaxID=1840409 RepID=UPI00131C6C1F|nr:lasso peptide biosynthesis PqqD family chaperone [Amycolatopsis anabasis]
MPLTLRPHVSATDTDDGMVLLDEASGSYYQLNPVGALILRALMDGADTDRAASAIAARYQVSRAQAADDIAALRAALREAGLVTR